MTSPLWRHRVTWRHRDHAQSIADGRIPIGCPLEPSRYLAFVSEIFSAKVPTKIITWWRHQWRHKARINYPWGLYRHHIEEHCVKISSNSDNNCRRSILKKNHDVTTMTSSGYVTSSIAHKHFPTGCPLEPSRYLASFPRYLAPKLRQRLLRDDVINGRHLGFDATGSRSIRSAFPDNPTIGSNTMSIGRSVAEIWPF